MQNIRKALLNLKKECLERKIKRIEMPRIGSGLDKQEWQET